jgi:hypothetical protein
MRLAANVGWPDTGLDRSMWPMAMTQVAAIRQFYFSHGDDGAGTPATEISVRSEVLTPHLCENFGSCPKARTDADDRGSAKGG